MIDFPSSPTPGQPYTSGGMTWVWDGVKWNSANTGAGVYLPLTGGTLTGQFNVAPAAASPVMVLNKPAGANINVLQGQTVAKARWDLVLGTGAAESTGNLGSDFAIQRHADDGTQIDTPFAINRASGAVISKGVSDGSNAAAGMVGEYISASLANASAIALVNATTANVTSISLTAGDWDAWGHIGFLTPGSTSVSAIFAALNSVSATFPADRYTITVLPTTAGAGNGATTLPPPQRFSLAATTTLYLVGQAVFSAGTCSAYGFIAARRVR